jgi:glutathione S-transferase
MSLKLYFGPGACSFVPHAMLQLSGADYEAEMVKLHKNEQGGEAFTAINPRAQVPVLAHDGMVIDQVVAILLYLDDLLPDAGILPGSGEARTRALQTLMWMNNTVHPTFTHIFMPQKFTDDAAAQAALRQFNTDLFAKRLGELDAMCAALPAGAWLSGDKPGALDAYAMTFLRWGSIAKIEPTQFKALWALAQSFHELPALQPVIERERLQLNLMPA